MRKVNVTRAGVMRDALRYSPTLLEPGVQASALLSLGFRNLDRALSLKLRDSGPSPAVSDPGVQSQPACLRSRGPDPSPPLADPVPGWLKLLSFHPAGGSQAFLPLRAPCLGSWSPHLQDALGTPPLPPPHPPLRVPLTWESDLVKLRVLWEPRAFSLL